MQASPRIDELRQKFHENPRRYFAPLANEYRKAGDPEQAIAICRAHLAQQPGHMSGHVVYGQALYDARRPEEARAIFEKALSLDPDNAVVLKQLGDIAREKGDSAEAKHWYSKAIDIDPHDTIVAAYIAELTEPISGDETPPAPTEEPASPQAEEPSAISAEPVAGSPSSEPLKPEPELEPAAIEAVESIGESTEIEVEEAVEAATPAEPQGDGADPESPDLAETDISAELAEASPDVVSDREVSLPEVREPEIDTRAAEPVTEAPAASQQEDAEDVEAAGEVAWRKTPQPQSSPFITRTMADLYARQGYTAAALDVYRQLALKDPDDAELRQRIAELSGEARQEIAPEPVAEVSAETAITPEFAEPSSAPEEASVERPPFQPLSEPFAELTAESEFPPSSEDLNLEPVETDDFSGGVHFTEMELSDRESMEHIELDESPFGELSWGDEIVEQSPAADVPSIPEPQAIQEPETEAVQEVAPVAEPAPSIESQPTTEPEAAAEPEPEVETKPVVEPELTVAKEADDLEVAAASEAAIPAEARFVDMPVGLGEVQTTIDEAGVAATSPHADDFPPAAPPDELAVASAGSTAAEDEAAEAMGVPDVEEVTEDAAPEEGSPVVAYSPEPPRDEDLPHFKPRTPTIREFFITLGAHRPSSRESAITAHAATPSARQRDEAVEDLPLATDAFSSLFPDEPVSEEDTRAAFALSGALSGTAHNPTPSTVRTSPPKPVPPVTDPPDQTKESEEDIRRFREWLDGLADS